MIDNQTKEELINRILKEKDIKKSQTYKMTSIEPVKSKTNDEMNGYIHQTDVLEFDGQLIEGARLTKNKTSIKAQNCKFKNLQFRECVCKDAVFINCNFEDFEIITSDLENIIFIACDFKRFNVKGSVTSKVNLKGMKLVRCTFDSSCDIKNTNLNDSQWLDTDINSIDIDTNPHSANCCTINGMIGDDLRDKSKINDDISTEIKNIDIKSLEKEVISDKEYRDETIDISLFVNTDFCNCKFMNCTFIDEIFENNDLYNYEMRSAFVNSIFECCVFSCMMKGIRFDNSSFIISELNGNFISCLFISTKFTKCSLTPQTMMNYSMFVNCHFEETDLDVLKVHELRESRGDVGVVICEQVERVQNIVDLENHIHDLQEEKEAAITESNNHIEELNKVRKALNELGDELFQKNEVIETAEAEKEKFELQIEEYEKGKLEMDKAMEMKDEEIKELRDNLEAVSKEKNDYEERITELQNTIEILQVKAKDGDSSQEQVETLTQEKKKLEENIIELQNTIELLQEQLRNTDGTSSINNEELVMDIVELIKEKTGIDLVKEKPVDEDATVQFLATLSEDERLNIFSKAAALRMQNAMMGNK